MQHHRKYSGLYEAQRELDARVVALEKEILEIKSQRNSLAPISLLPPEVLCRILLYCKSSSWYRPKPPAPSRRFPGRITVTKHLPESQTITQWTIVTHVCRQWRTIALQYGELWNDLSGTLPRKWLNAMAERSANVPVSVTFQPHDMNNLYTQKTLFGAIATPSRWKTVTIRYNESCNLGPGCSISEELQKLRTPAPFLVNFTLTFSGDLHGRALPCLPEDFLQGSAPKLRKLELVHCVLPWQSNLFRGLTSLRLCLPPSGSRGDVRPTTERFEEILSLMPGLDTLDLEMQFPDMASLGPSKRRLHLPSLSFLRLVGATSELAGLLGVLRIPSSCHIQLRCAKSDAPSLARVGDALKQAWLSLPAIRFALVDREYFHSTSSSSDVLIRGYANSRVEESPRSCILSISIMRLCSWSTQWAARVLPPLPLPLSIFPLDNIEEVKFSHIPPHDGSPHVDWPLMFETLRPVKRLHLTVEVAQSFMTAASQHHQSDSGGGPHFMPNMERLTLDAVNIVPDEQTLSKYGPKTREKTVVIEHIAQILQNRMKTDGGTRLKQLEFVDCCGMSSKLEKTLRDAGVTDDILWSGEEDPIELYDPLVRNGARTQTIHVVDVFGDDDDDDDDDDDSEEDSEEEGYAWDGF